MNVRPLSKELQEKATNDINEVSNRIEHDIAYVKNWLKKQPHLNARTDDQWILSFLRGCKFSLQRTQLKLDRFCTYRGLIPEFFANRDPLLPEIQDILQRGIFIPVPDVTGSVGPIPVIIRWGKADPDKNSAVNLVKVLLMGLDVLLCENDNFAVAGIITIHDLKNYSLSYILQITPTFLKKTRTFELSYPMRTQAMYMINCWSIAEKLVKLFTPLISKKLQHRLKIYGEDESNKLHNEILELPKDYGGPGDTVDNLAALWKTKVESYRDWFLDDAQYISDETKRPGKPTTSADLFGVEGCFRELNID